MQTLLTVAIDPALAAHRAPITWVLREACVALGYRWQEVPWGTVADLVYAGEGYAGDCGVLIETAGWTTPLPSGHATDRWVPVDVDDRGRRVVGRDLVRELFRIMTGAAEATWQRVPDGSVEVPPAFRAAIRVAVGSRLVDALGRVLVDSGRPAGAARWPGGALAAAAFTHDVDYPEIVRLVEPARVLRRHGLRGARLAWDTVTGRRHHWHFESWMAHEEAQGIRSAFYFSAYRGSLARFARGGPDPVYDITTPRLSAVIGRLRANGWEVGLRASHHAWRHPGTVAREKAALEAIVGEPILGVRHPGGRLDPDDPARTHAEHEAAGFLYDTSLTHDRHMGFRRGMAWPYRPWNPVARRAMAAMELPTCWVEEHSFRHWRGGREAADLALDELVATVLSVGGCLVANATAHAVDPRLHPGRFHMATALMQLLADDPRFWKSTPAGVARHWEARQHACESASSGLDLPETAPPPDPPPATLTETDA